jgi:hypothetical protein
MAEDYESGASAPVTGASRSLEEVTKAELLELPPVPARPSWMITRFPVDIEEWQRLELEARKPNPQHAALGALEDTTTEDQDREVEAILQDPPEGEVATMAAVVTAPSILASFDAIAQTPWRPPDNSIAVGPNDVLIAVNTDLAGYTKTGTLRFRWPNMTTLFSLVTPAGATLFDPRLAYDHYTQRWIVVVAARRNSPAGSWILVGVSQGPDPAGSYWIWATDAMVDGTNPTNNWADYPMLGFDSQAIYISSNMFQVGGGFQYPKLRVLNKAELYSGGTGPGHNIRWYDFWNLKNPDGSVAFTVQPAVHFRGTGGNPPAYLVNALWPTGNVLTMWTLSNPLAFWSGGTSTLAKDAINCRTYDIPPSAIQPGTTTRLVTNDSRLLNVIYQNVGGTQHLWTCHTSAHTWAGDSEARAVVQWYEIDVPSKAVVQQNAYGRAGSYYFFPAIQTDISRNAYLVFTRSGASEFGQVRQTGRRVSDPANDLQGSVLVKSGESSYTGERWGDYLGICRDGGDASAVWMYGEYAGTGDTWATRVCNAQF